MTKYILTVLSTAITFGVIVVVLGAMPNYAAIVGLYVFVRVVNSFIEDWFEATLSELIKINELAKFLVQFAYFLILIYLGRLIIGCFDIDFDLTGWQFSEGVIIDGVIICATVLDVLIFAILDYLLGD